MVLRPSYPSSLEVLPPLQCRRGLHLFAQQPCYEQMRQQAQAQVQQQPVLLQRLPGSLPRAPPVLLLLSFVHARDWVNKQSFQGLEQQGC